MKGVTPTPPPIQTWRGASPLKSNRPCQFTFEAGTHALSVFNGLRETEV